MIPCLFHSRTIILSRSFLSCLLFYFYFYFYFLWPLHQTKIVYFFSHESHSS
ncbi:MAG: hypothetical protein MCS20_02290 [Candidatus Phytoplasma mali]|nr:hypothetical protein [Candidatus Phytoplasma mali]